MEAVNGRLPDRLTASNAVVLLLDKLTDAISSIRGAKASVRTNLTKVSKAVNAFNSGEVRERPSGDETDYEVLVTSSPSRATPTSAKRRKRPATREKKKKTKDPNAPKRPSSSFLLFKTDVQDDVRKKFPELAYRDVVKKIGTMWNGLHDAQKLPYIQAWESGKAQYLRDKQAYEAQKQRAGPPRPHADGGSPSTL
ncbi:hypothetical protein JCM10212_002242 [Sporobolomyces blumeae]